MKTMRLTLVLALCLSAIPALFAGDEPATQPKPATESQPATQKAAQPDPPRKLSDDEYYELFKSFADTIDQVERNYVKEVDRRELMEAAIKGVFSKLDPYSSYIAPEEFAGFKTAVESQFGGIGIQITIDEGQLKVLSPLVGTPAYRAGIQAGDRIVEIEGEPTKGVDIDEAVRRLKGEAGTTVTITVVHRAGEQGGNGHAQARDDPRRHRAGRSPQSRTTPGTSCSIHDQADRLHPAHGLQPRHGKRIEEGARRVESGKYEGADPRSAVQSRRAVDLGHRDQRHLFCPTGRIVSTKGRNTPEQGWDAEERGHVRRLSDGRAGESLQRQRQRDRRGLPAGPQAGRGDRRAHLGQRERAERHRAGRRAKAR